MKWFIVIVCSEDWYTILSEVKVIRATDSNDAINKAMDGKSKAYHVEAVFDCGKTKPKEI